MHRFVNTCMVVLYRAESRIRVSVPPPAAEVGSGSLPPGTATTSVYPLNRRFGIILAWWVFLLTCLIFSSIRTISMYPRPRNFTKFHVTFDMSHIGGSEVVLTPKY